MRWPISKSTSQDFPLSSTFGPRLKASEDFQYDWHRGIDISVPCNTSMHAISNGGVRMAGDYSSLYTDRLFQICHPKQDQPQTGFSNATSNR